MISKISLTVPANGTIDNDVQVPHNTVSWYISRAGVGLIEVIPKGDDEWVWPSIKLDEDAPGVHIDIPEVTGFSLANLSNEDVVVTIRAMVSGGGT